MEVSRKHCLRYHSTTFVFYVSCQKNRNQGTRKVFLKHCICKLQHNHVFHATRAEAFPRFCATLAEASSGLSLSFAEARKHALKNILCHRRLPRSFENYLDHPLPSSPQTYLPHRATMLLEHIAAQGLHIHRMHRICITQKHYQLAMLPHIHYRYTIFAIFTTTAS